MPFFPERMSCAYQHGVLSEQFQQLCRREKGAFGFVQLQTMIQLQNSLHGSNAQHMAALGDVGLHTGKYFQSVKHIRISLAGSLCGNIAVKQFKLLRVEMLCQTDGIQPRTFCFVQKPVGIFRGKGQILCQLSMGVKINIHSTCSNRQINVEIRTVTAIQRKEADRKRRSLFDTHKDDNLIFFTSLLTAA